MPSEEGADHDEESAGHPRAQERVVEAPIAHAFAVFTEGQNTWWPRAHHIGSRDNFTAILEPRVGGRWFERGDDGSECNWGRVLAWEAPRRVVLSWDIGPDWKYDPELGTEVEVRFTAESAERTRVDLEHRKLDRFGDKAEAMRALFDSPSAWLETLKTTATAAETPRDGSVARR